MRPCPRLPFFFFLLPAILRSEASYTIFSPHFRPQLVPVRDLKCFSPLGSLHNFPCFSTMNSPLSFFYSEVQTSLAVTDLKVFSTAPLFSFFPVQTRASVQGASFIRISSFFFFFFDFYPLQVFAIHGSFFFPRRPILDLSVFLRASAVRSFLAAVFSPSVFHLLSLFLLFEIFDGGPGAFFSARQLTADPSSFLGREVVLRHLKTPEQDFCSTLCRALPAFFFSRSWPLSPFSPPSWEIRVFFPLKTASPSLSLQPMRLCVLMTTGSPCY